MHDAHPRRMMHEHKNTDGHLKTDLATDHAAEAGTAGPATVHLALDKHVAVFIADSGAAAAAVALVVGVERTRDAGRRGARVGVRDAYGLHWISRGAWGSKGVMICC
jgi:hypothetical protein